MAKANWEELRSFMTVVETGSLSAAAQSMNLSVATLGRRVDGLEHTLGLKLLKRGTRGAQPTIQGRRIFEQITAGSIHLEQIDRMAKSMVSENVSTPIRISSTEPMISEVLAPKVHILLAKHPNARLVFETSLATANLNRGDADIAIRMFRPMEETLIAQKLPDIPMGLFATKEHLSSRSPNTTDPSDLKLLWYDDLFGDIPENQWLNQNGLAGNVVVRSSSVRALIQLAGSGLGVAPLPKFLAAKHELVELENIRLPTRNPWLVFHRDDRNMKAHKTVRAWIKQTCKSTMQTSA